MLITNRRKVLSGMGAFGVATLLGGCSNGSKPAPQPFFSRIDKPLGIQLYALGPEAGEDLGATFAQVRDMGYGLAELPNLYGREPAEVRRLSDEAGLPIASLHVHPVALFPGTQLALGEDIDAVMDAAETLGTKDIVIPIPVMPEGFEMREGEGFREATQRALGSAGIEHWQAMAQMFNGFGEKISQRGLRLAYHNHNVEFAPVGESNGWDILMSETDPELVKVQLDIAWTKQAGFDPLEELRKLEGRVISLHVKDVAEGFTPGYWFSPDPTEVGSGVIDWATILPAAAEAGVDHYFVEQEPPFTTPRPEAMKKSADYLNKLIA